MKPCECQARDGYVSCDASQGCLQEGFYCRFNPPSIAFVDAKVEQGKMKQAREAHAKAQRWMEKAKKLEPQRA